MKPSKGLGNKNTVKCSIKCTRRGDRDDEKKLYTATGTSVVLLYGILHNNPQGVRFLGVYHVSFGSGLGFIDFVLYSLQI